MESVPGVRQGSPSEVTDPKRLAQLAQLALLDTPTEHAFDRMTWLATQVLHVPVALVSLVDHDRQFLKSCIGLPEPWAAARQTPLTHSICQYVVETGEPLIIPDARTNPLTQDNLAIRDLNVVAYAGFPLRTPDGYVLGSFCALDREPREWTEQEINILRELAASVITEIDLRAEVVAREQAEEELRQLNAALDSRVQERTAELQASEERFRALIQHGSDVITILGADGTIHYQSPAIKHVLGYEPLELVGDSAFSYVHPDDLDALAQTFTQALQRPTLPIACDFRFHHQDGSWRMLEAIGANLLDHPTVNGIVTTSRDVTERNEWAAAIQQSHEQLYEAYDATLEGWAAFLDLRDRESEGHTRRVTELTVRLARAAGIPDGDIEHIYRGALLHDMGKMGVPDAVLLKPGPLTDEEWVIMRKHPEFAYEILSPITFLHPALTIPYAHHEKWDGSGYPRGLRGEDIPLEARLFAVVDVWDALRSDRPYRKAWHTERVLEHIAGLSGTHFDPRAVDLFLTLIGEDQDLDTDGANHDGLK